MRLSIVLSTAVASLAALPVSAGPKEDLVAAIVAAGTNETAEERHTVEITGCTLTTYRWMNVGGDDWLLWTSFQFSMPDANLPDLKQSDGSILHHLYLPDDSLGDGLGTALVFFTMREDTTARFEKPIERKAKRATTPSPRGDGTTHYFEEVTDFFYSHDGEDVDAKARQFTTGYKRYVQDYCTFTG